jgi:carbon-monoxide dehydrogenase catalytic subunit
MNDPAQRSVDPASIEMLRHVAELKQPVIWDRYDTQQPQCGFGQLGLCCRNCTMGPCRIDPFGHGPREGICGATADVIAARNLARMVAAGTAAHSDHGRDVAHALASAAGEGEFAVKDEHKLRSLANEWGIPSDGRSMQDVAGEVSKEASAQFGQQEGALRFIERAPRATQNRWKEAGVIPRGIDREVVDLLHRTNIGCDSDHRHIMFAAVRTALADGWGGSMIATELQDILFCAPQWLRSQTNLGVLSSDQVNIVVHGHEPILSEMLVAATLDPELTDLARKHGAAGINLCGICCTANEILMRHGIPVAGNFLQQELAIATGAVDAMIVDIQCILPALDKMASCFHTKLISTSAKADFPGTVRLEFDENEAMKTARQIVQLAVENFPNRDPSSVRIPDASSALIAGFSAENLFTALGGRYRPSYRPLNDAILSGRLRGLAAVVGCNNPKHLQDAGHLAITRELLANDVLVATTGCTAIADAKAGLLCPEAAIDNAGQGVQEICRAVGIPPVLHLGACVDISRILVLLSNVVAEGGLGESIADLPAAAAAPEWMSEKAVAIGFYAAGSGAFTVLGEPFPVEGAPGLTQFLTQEMEQTFGGKFAFEKDPVKAARLMIDHIDARRAALHLPGPMYPVPYASQTEGELAPAG